MSHSRGAGEIFVKSLEFFTGSDKKGKLIPKGFSTSICLYLVHAFVWELLHLPHWFPKLSFEFFSSSFPESKASIKY